MKLLLVTDAWTPQVNGVVRTIQATIKQLEIFGFEVRLIHPGLFKTFTTKKYPEISIVFPIPNFSMCLGDYTPDHVHVFTEGSLGLAGRSFAKKRGIPLTSSYHTDFPTYMKKYFRIPRKLTYKYLKWFHGASNCVMVNTPHVKNDLAAEGFKNLGIWGRGVDSDLFFPKPTRKLSKVLVLLYVGRVAVEKNIEAFLDLPDYFVKRVVGDGPELIRLKAEYPSVDFRGYKFGEELAEEYREADCFVFPSKSDTFGLVMVEAAACGTPVAAYPVQGPIDVVENGKIGFLDEDLLTAVLKASCLSRADVAEYAKKFSWENSTLQFIKNIL